MKEIDGKEGEDEAASQHDVKGAHYEFLAGLLPTLAELVGLCALLQLKAIVGDFLYRAEAVKAPAGVCDVSSVECVVLISRVTGKL